MARIEDGEYVVTIQGLVKVLKNFDLPTKKLYAFKELAETARKEEYTPDEFKKASASIGVSTDLLIKLVVPTNPTEFYAFIGALIMAIGLYLQFKNKASSVLNNFTNNYYSRETKKKPKKKLKDTTEIEKMKARRVGNNFINKR